jgi:glutamine amidotransferase PdxT
VLCRRATVWAAAFHPELTHDLRIHAAFLTAVRAPVSPPPAGGM